MQKLTPQTNVPLAVRLQFTEGKECPSNYGNGKQFMFTTDQGTLYVSEAVGNIFHDQIRRQAIRPGDPVEIVKAVEGNRTQWKITKIAGYGEQQDGTFVVPVHPAAGVRAPATARAASQPHNSDTGNGSNGNGPTASQQPAHAHMPWALHLLNVTNALSDVYAAALSYASHRHGNQVKPEDVRQLMTTAFINLSKKGGPDVG